MLSAPRESYENRDAFLFSCPNCGNFALSGSAEEVFINHYDPDKSFAFSHFLRKMQETQERPLVTSDVAEEIIRTAAYPTPQEQADNLIRWLGFNCPGPGELVSMYAQRQGAIIGAKSEAGFAFIIKGLLDQKLLVGEPIVRTEVWSVSLSFQGWKRYEELRRGSPSGRKAFIAMPFGDNEMDALVNDHFRPAVRDTGFELKRLDDEPRAGLIDDRLRVEIQGARFLIADLTHGNKGAYWEAGYAEGLQKPVIYTCEESVFDTTSHFDTNHHLTVLWNRSRLDDAARRLKATIRATIPEARREDPGA